MGIKKIEPVIEICGGTVNDEPVITLSTSRPTVHMSIKEAEELILTVKHVTEVVERATRKE